MISLKQTVYIIKPGAEDDWGIAQPGQEIPVKGRVDWQRKIITTADGTEIVSSATAILKGPQDISAGDWLKWTDALGNTHQRKPLEVAPLSIDGVKVLFTQVIL